MTSPSHSERDESCGLKSLMYLSTWFRIIGVMYDSILNIIYFIFTNNFPSDSNLTSIFKNQQNINKNNFYVDVDWLYLEKLMPSNQSVGANQKRYSNV